MSKQRVNVSLDPKLVELAKFKLGIPLSTFFNNVLDETLNSSDNLEEVKEQIREKEVELDALRSKKCRLEQLRILEMENRKKLDECLPTLERIHSVSDCIGENQILFIANHNGINFNNLLNYCKKQGFNIIKGLEHEKEGKGGKYGTVVI